MKIRVEFDELPPLEGECRECVHGWVTVTHQGVPDVRACDNCGATGRAPTEFGAAVLALVRKYGKARDA